MNLLASAETQPSYSMSGGYGGQGRVTFSFLLALNFFRQSTVSCLCMQEATVDRCWRKWGKVCEWEAGLPKAPSVGCLTERCLVFGEHKSLF